MSCYITFLFSHDQGQGGEPTYAKTTADTVYASVVLTPFHFKIAEVLLITKKTFMTWYAVQRRFKERICVILPSQKDADGGPFTCLIEGRFNHEWSR